MEKELVKCSECNRVFDLMKTEQAEDWYYGHDCTGGW